MKTNSIQKAIAVIILAPFWIPLSIILIPLFAFIWAMGVLFDKNENGGPYD